MRSWGGFGQPPRTHSAVTGADIGPIPIYMLQPPEARADGDLPRDAARHAPTAVPAVRLDFKPAAWLRRILRAAARLAVSDALRQDTGRIWFTCLRQRMQTNRRMSLDWYEVVTDHFQLPRDTLTG